MVIFSNAVSVVPVGFSGALNFSQNTNINMGQILTQIYKSFGLSSSSESDFDMTYNYLAGEFVTNVETYFSAPNAWCIATYLIS